jgi:hypothetical protein
MIKFQGNKTAEYYLSEVLRDGNMLVFVPDAYRTTEIFTAAVQYSGHLLAYVPEALRTPELCTLAVMGDEYMLRYVLDPVLFVKLAKQFNIPYEM